MCSFPASPVRFWLFLRRCAGFRDFVCNGRANHAAQSISSAAASSRLCTAYVVSRWSRATKKHPRCLVFPTSSAGILRSIGRELAHAFEFLNALQTGLGIKEAAVGAPIGSLVQPSGLDSIDRNGLRACLRVVMRFREFMDRRFRVELLDSDRLRGSALQTETGSCRTGRRRGLIWPKTVEVDRCR